jgi:hypothetical protein
MPAGDDWQLGVPPCPPDARCNVKKTHEIFSCFVDSFFVCNRVGLERVLGAPLSFDGEHISNWVQEKVDTANSLLAKISLLQDVDPASEWLLLKFCGSTRSLYYGRMHASP